MKDIGLHRDEIVTYKEGVYIVVHEQVYGVIVRPLLDPMTSLVIYDKDKIKREGVRV